MGVSKRKSHLIEETRGEMRKKVSFTKAMTRISLCEKELITKCDEITSPKVAALKAVMDSCWKKVDKHLPNLQSVEGTIDVNHYDAREMSDSELASIAAGSSTGASEQTEGEKVTH